jgi:ElaB/YqjD/DUF883 family membrane-anchored ribosome-binding protein
MTTSPTGRIPGDTDSNLTEASTAGAGAPEPVTAAAGAPPSDDPDAIRADIERTREDLGDNVEALAAKADVRARAQQRLAGVKDRARHAAQDASQRAKATAQQAGDRVRQRPAPTAGVLAAVAAVVGAVVGAVVLSRRRRPAQTRTRWRRSR